MTKHQPRTNERTRIYSLSLYPSTVAKLEALAEWGNTSIGGVVARFVEDAHPAEPAQPPRHKGAAQVPRAVRRLNFLLKQAGAAEDVQPQDEHG